MSKIKILMNFGRSKYTDSGLSVLVWHIIEKMTGNPNFPTPRHSMADMVTKATAYDKWLGKVINGSKEDTYYKNESRKEIETMLKEQAEYVQTTSDGNVGMMLSSGFEVSKERESYGPLPAPTNLTAKPGANKGSMELACDKVDGAHFYEFLYTQFPVTAQSIWTKEVSSCTKILIIDLERGKQYAFKAAAGGADASRNWSDEINSFIL